MSSHPGDADALYAGFAARYDQETRFITGIRRQAVAALALRPDEVVLDAGCGTGWCLPLLAAGVGESGRVLAFEPSPDMLAIARDRVSRLGLKSVSLRQSTGASAALDCVPDAILFSYTHDLLQSAGSLENIVRQARPGTRVVAVGTRLFPWWFAPGNWYLRATHRQTITNFQNFDAPWKTLATFCAAHRVRSTVPGSRYLFEGKIA